VVVFDVCVKRAGSTVVCVLLLVFAAGAQAARGPSDFEMAGPASGAASAAATGAFKSHVLKAPGRFDLVGMRWSGHVAPTISLRARKAGGHWSKWTRVPSDPGDAPDPGSREHSPRGFSAPVWTGDADYLQYKLSRRVSGLRLHFVSVPPATQHALAARAMAARRTDTTTNGQPTIQPRSAWGAQDCPPRSAPDYGDVQVAFVHHTVSANDYTAEEVPSIILSICRYHRNSNGWNDIGYNFLVDKFGTIWEGRAGGIDKPVVGAHAQGYNSHSTGIADIGTHQDVSVSDAELTAYAALIRWKLPLSGAPTQGTVTLTSGGGSLNRYKAGTPVTLNRVSGHRDGDSTECPGDAFYAQLPELRQLVGNVQPTQPVLARTLLDVSLSPGSIVYPKQATVAGTLRQVNGDVVPGAPVAVQAYGTAGWRNTWSATTGDDGSFKVAVGARLTHKIRVVFAGDPGRQATDSSVMTLNVVPELQLQRSAARRPVGQTVTLSGTVQPSKTRLQLVVERRLGKQKSVGTLALAAHKGHFARSYKFHSSGLFRFYVRFSGDTGNAAAKSTAVYVRALPGATVKSTPGGGSQQPAPAGQPSPSTGGGVSPGGGVSAARAAHRP
jgi:hypothetical protein